MLFAPWQTFLRLIPPLDFFSPLKMPRLKDREIIAADLLPPMD
jgi:hypothetical protein